VLNARALAAALLLLSLASCVHRDANVDRPNDNNMIATSPSFQRAAATDADPLAFCDWYMREWLPARLSAAEVRMLGGVGKPVALAVVANGETREWKLLARDGRLLFLEDGHAAACRFTLPLAVFRRVVSAEVSPQRAFFSGDLSVQGNAFLALKVGSLLEGIFRRSPLDWDAELEGRRDLAAGAASQSPSSAARLTDRQRDLLALHLHPREGAPWWIERSAAMGARADDFATLGDLEAFGPLDREAMVLRPFRDFLPRSLREQPKGLILGETGGTTGLPLTMAWSPADFQRAFVDPLPRELAKRGVAGLTQWLFVGPSGPHIIGKAADALALATTGVDALKVDFDPRWHRKLAPGSAAAARHLEHIAGQALDHLRRGGVDALFATPSLLERLLRDDANRALFEPVRLVHLGGQSATPEEIDRLAGLLPSKRVLVNGYGNSMFGCLVEHRADEPLTYPDRDGDRAIVLLRDPEDRSRDVPVGAWGTVAFHRFDESALLLNAFERDEALRVREGELRQPRPPRAKASLAAGGIY
jgi:thienamycin biosynthesis protein ThnN